MRLSIIWIIFRKEITEALRDRVTMFVLIGLPLLLYPLGLLTTIGVTQHFAAVEDRQVSNVAVWGVGAAPLFDWLTPTNHQLKLERWENIPATLRSELEAGRLEPAVKTNLPTREVNLGIGLGQRQVPTAPPPEDSVLRAAREVVTGKQADAVLIVWPGFDADLQQHSMGRVSVYYDSVIPKSAQAWSRLSGQLEGLRKHLLKERLRERSLPKGFITALDVRGDNVAPIQRQISNVSAQIMPFIIIVLALLGGLMAAADMAAGEKERGTMQTLLCAPVRSFEIVAGKFLAVWSVSLVSALANIVGLGFMIWRITAQLQVQLIGFGMLVAVCGLLLTATWTIAALFLAVAALARDMKDAGNFLSGTAIAVLLPLSATVLPGVELDAWTCCVPLLNLCLLIRTLMISQAAGPLIFLTLLSSLAYAGLALALAARVFGREQILLGGAFSWRSFLQGDRQRPVVATPGFVLALFPVVAVGLFYVSLALMEQGAQIMLLGTQYGVLLLPVVALAVARKFPLAQTFSLRWPNWRSLVGAVLIGLTASVGLAGLVMRLAPPPDSLLRELAEFLKLGSAPLWQLWLVIALTPALCEEAFFRGLMLSGLRRWGPGAAIGITALLFGLLHGSIYRLLPTFLLGLVLGYAVWRSGSLYCSILIHALNNGLIATLIWSGGGKDLANQSFPWSLTLGALAIMGIGLALLTGPKPRAALRGSDAEGVGGGG